MFSDSVHRRQRCRWVVPVLALVAVAIGAGPGARPAGAVESPPAASAAAVEDGWWNRLQGPQEGEPEDNPIRPLLPPLPAPPTVPEGTIAAGVAGGEPDKVAAVGIDVTLPAGGRIEALTMRLAEAPGAPGINPDAAHVVACPATTPWGPATNADWRDRPEADCDLAQADGVRGDDGTWTFDLTAVGDLWVGPVAFLVPYGVVLAVDAGDSPAVAQVNWLDVQSGQVVVELVAAVTDPALPAPVISPAGEAGPPVEAPAEAPVEAPAPAPDAEFFDPLAFPAAQPAFGPTPAPAGAPEAAVPPETTGPAAAPQEAQPAAAPRARPVVGFWDNLPAATVLLVIVALAVALLAGLALGPDGRPRPVWPRTGGLSRALARRSPGGGGDVV